MAENSLPPSTKRCRTCKEIKALVDFYSDGRNKARTRASCKACVLTAQYKKYTQRIGHFECEPGFKICTCCVEKKALTEFYPQKNKRDGRRSHCIPCVKILQRKTNKEAVRRYYARNRKKLIAIARAYNQKNVERIRINDSVRHRKRREEQLARMGVSPRPKQCEICGSDGQYGNKSSLVVDHCHRSGHFRGWLCHKCNLTLGHVDDNVELLRKMISYLESRNALD